MSSRWDDISPLGETFTEATLEQMRMVLGHAGVSNQVLASMRVDSVRDMVRRDLTVMVTADIMAEHVDTKRIREEATRQVPATWWAHWKHAHANRWWLRWYVRRHPPAMSTITFALDVDITRYYLYPFAQLEEDPFGPARRYLHVATRRHLTP